MPYRRSAHVQQRLDAQHAAIRQAANKLLAEHGYAGCSVAAVAAQAGVATGTVYRHFSGKAALVAELFGEIVTREVAAVELAGRQPGPAAERVNAVLEAFANRALKTPRQAYALLAEPVDAPVEEQRLVFRRAYSDVIAKVVVEGVSSGELPPQDAELTAAALVGATAEVLIGPLTTGDTSVLPELRNFTFRALGADYA